MKERTKERKRKRKREHTRTYDMTCETKLEEESTHRRKISPWRTRGGPVKGESVSEC